MREEGPGKGSASVAEEAATQPDGSRRTRQRVVALVAITVFCLAVAGGYVLVAALRDPGAGSAASVSSTELEALADQPHLLFLDNDGDTYRRVAAAPDVEGPAPVDRDDGRLISDLQCQRFYFAAGRGLCVEANPVRGSAFVVDDTFMPVHEIPVSGLPSRARVSPDGRYGSMTLFVTGHSYTEGTFSTATILIDMADGTELGNLEDFTVYRDGQEFDAEDFNFWGVTFAEDSNRFYATLAAAGSTYLIEGDVAGRTATVLRDNVECPSLSPDGTRIAFKKLVDSGLLGNPIWQLHLLDLATMEERPLGDTRSVDDQVEWVDDQHLVYAVRDEGPPATIRPDLWLLPLDGAPTRVVLGGSSPVWRSAAS